MSSYQYKPITKPRGIRTVHLRFLASGNPQCTIQETGLSNARFTALSYAWGSPEKPFKMEVLDEFGRSCGFVPLTRNLNDALHDLMNSHAVQEEGSEFWVDQICINQQDHAERSAQVAMMSQIYLHASLVITYLGKEEPGDQDALKLLKNIEEHFFPYYKEVKARRPSQPVPKHLQFAVDSKDATYLRLMAMATGDWAKRLWIVQENMLNMRTIMLRGAKAPSWLAVAYIPYLVVTHLLPLVESTDPAQLRRSVYLLECCQSMKTASLTTRVDPKKNGPKLHQALHMFQSHCCFDSRDKVFALLSFVRDSEKLGLAPDYTKSVQEVYTDTATQILRVEKDLSLLDSAYPEEAKMLNLPSWVPSWTGKSGPLNPEHGNNASHGPRRQMTLNSSVPGQLCLKGLRVDRIKKSLGSVPPCSVLREHPNREGAWSCYLRFSEIMADVVEELGHLRLKEIQSIFTSTLLTDPTWPDAGWRHVESASKAFRSFMALLNKTFRSQIETLANSFIVSGSLEDGTWDKEDAELAFLANALRNLRNENDDDQLGEEFRRRIKVSKRSICITEGGKLCLAPEDAEPGDAIVVLCGGSYLYVLRYKYGGQMGRFEYVGNAYVHEMMDGEAQEKARISDFETFKIV